MMCRSIYYDFYHKHIEGKENCFSSNKNGEKGPLDSRQSTFQGLVLADFWGPLIALIGALLVFKLSISAIDRTAFAGFILAELALLEYDCRSLSPNGSTSCGWVIREALVSLEEAIYELNLTVNGKDRTT